MICIDNLGPVYIDTIGDTSQPTVLYVRQHNEDVEAMRRDRHRQYLWLRSIGYRALQSWIRAGWNVGILTASPPSKLLPS